MRFTLKLARKACYSIYLHLFFGSPPAGWRAGLCPWPRPGMQCLAILYDINRYYIKLQYMLRHSRQGRLGG